MSENRSQVQRCQWAVSEAAVAYHDNEWGVPLHDDAALFEMLTLEGAQAGLSWETILRKREGYRRVFARFDPRRVARFSGERVERILLDPGIVRNRAKVRSTVSNAAAILRAQEEFGSFDAYLWRFVDGRPVRNRWNHSREMPASSPLSDALSEDLRKRGYSFVGSTICYSFMQAVGMIDDHVTSCFARRT